jgi:hypothetical protein
MRKAGQPFRARADECRSRAELSYDLCARDRMLKLAANYERIADEADELNGNEFSDESCRATAALGSTRKV